MLRPEPGGRATLAKARAAGFEAFALPLFRIEPVAWQAPASPFDGLLLTSANAVRQAGEQLQLFRSLPAHAVGDATAAAAREAGLTVATIGNAGVEALLAGLPPSLRLLHLCGEHRRAPATASQPVTQVTVYRSAALADPPGLERLNGAAALVHSPRAGERLAELVGDRSATTIIAISPAAAAACGSGWAAVLAADRPSDEAMLSLAATLCEQSCRT